MNQVKESYLEQLEKAVTPQQLEQWGEHIQTRGYPAFSNLLEQFKERIKHIEDDQIDMFLTLVDKAESAIPNPGAVSPSWERIWTELRMMVRFKKETLQAVPANERDGEWQIIMDNPFTNEPIACYPGLSFLEASYLYAYFRPGMKKNEYIRMQKIVDLLVYNGE